MGGDEYVTGFDSSDSSIHFNDGIGGGNEEWNMGMGGAYYLTGPSPAGVFGHGMEAEHELDDDSMTGSYTATNNLVEVEVTETDIDDGESETGRDTVMFTPHSSGADLFISSEFEIESGTEPCDGCTDNQGNPVTGVNETEEDAEIDSDVGLKKGQVALTNADISGQYLLQLRGSEIECTQGDVDGNTGDYYEWCSNSAGQESIAAQVHALAEVLVTFNGAGSCT
ncbi:MAG: hypothetical protein GY934_10300, partial [Gammaproteobacteria bacterium]|nr:hypothetical protein [Gammaproteobacteria bacterium]